MYETVCGVQQQGTSLSPFSTMECNFISEVLKLVEHSRAKTDILCSQTKYNNWNVGQDKAKQ